MAEVSQTRITNNMTYRDHQAISRDIRKNSEWNAASINQKLEAYRNASLIIDGKIQVLAFMVLYPLFMYLLTKL